MRVNTSFHYIIVNTVTGKAYKKNIYSFAAQYATEKGAKIVATKLTNRTGELHVAKLSMEFFPSTATKKVRNMMTGVEVEISEDTPACCDPSTESYWSM